MKTAHSNENEEPKNTIPSMNEAIDIKNPQYHIKQTYLNELTVEFNQNQGKTETKQQATIYNNITNTYSTTPYLSLKKTT
ncbi:hypothetical protein QE152_g41056 [Popillia japonica]|uniref:Uncharacterized protein n=1 Tax=Popillia japonica TaxID=7064 RepID=A0AAW1H5G2_POPJA